MYLRDLMYDRKLGVFQTMMTKGIRYQGMNGLSRFLSHSSQYHKDVHAFTKALPSERCLRASMYGVVGYGYKSPVSIHQATNRELYNAVLSAKSKILALWEA
jgi:hypothetical protein